MHKERVEGMLTENRRLKGEHDSLQRAYENAKELSSSLER